MKPWREKEWWILAGIIALFFWQPLTTQTLFFRDLTLLFFPKKLLLATALRSGQIPLWDPLMHGGQPFLASPNNTFFAPTNVLYLFLPPLTAFNVVFVVQFIFCGWAAYGLARVLRLSPVAAFVCGATYALCGYSLSTANLLPLILSLPWVPATLAFAHLFATEWRGRWLVLGSISAALPLLSGGAELTAMMFIAVAVWLLFGPVQDIPLRRRAVALVALMAFSAGLSLMQTVPAAEMIRQSSRAVKRTYSDFSQWSLSPRRIPELVIPGFFGPTDVIEESDYWGKGFEGGLPYILSIYVGGPALLLAIAGATSGVLPRRARWCLSALAIAGVVFSLGSALPFFRVLYDYVPLLGIFRYPVKAMLLSLVPIAVLAAAGTEALRERATRVTIAASVALSIVLIVAFLMREMFGRMYFAIDLAPRLQSELSGSLLHAAGATMLFTLVLMLQRSTARDIRPAIAFLVLLDLIVAGHRVNAVAPRELFAENPLARAVREAVGDGRFYSAPQPNYVIRAPSNDVAWLAWDDRRLLRGYAAAAFGIPMIFHKDYDGLAPIGAVRLTDIVNRLPWPQRLNVLTRSGVTAFLSPERVQAPGLEETLVETGTRIPLYLYRNRSAMPFRFESTCGRARGRLRNRSLNSIEVEIDAPCDGYLILNETFFQGWKATVDGRAAKLLRADYTFTAVPVAKGHHVVRKVYRPTSVIAGLAASLVSLGLLVGVALQMRRQRSFAAV